MGYCIYIQIIGPHYPADGNAHADCQAPPYVCPRIMKQRTAKTVMPQAHSKTRVIKKLSPEQSGALKLARQYGETLVCVRYRKSADGFIRYTTVELVVDAAPLAKRLSGDALLAIQLEGREFELRQRVKSGGGKWDPEARVWRLPRRKVKHLGLLGRVVDR